MEDAAIYCEGRDSETKEMAIHSSILARRIPCTWGCKESDTTERLSLSHTHAHTHVCVEGGTQGFHLFRLSLVNYLGSPGGSSVKNPPVMQETQVQSLGWEDPLEKEMATHSSILAWRIPWTVELGGLQSVVVQSQT